MQVSAQHQRMSAGVSERQWYCDLAEGLLKPKNSSDINHPQPFSTFKSLGFPAVSSIPMCEQLVDGHPLEPFIRKVKPLSINDLHQVLSHPLLDLSLIGFKTGSVTAALNPQMRSFEGAHHCEDYSRNMWTRDSIITATALNRAGFSDVAEQIIKNLWSFTGGQDHRGKILQFHWGSPEERRRLFLDGNNGPHVKFSVGNHGELNFCDHDWGHQQLDALGAMVWAPYRFANQDARYGQIGNDPRFDLRSIDPDQNAKDSILPATIKMFFGAGVHNTLDYGPWEDIREWRRATSVGIVVAGLHEAKIFHEREGWEHLPAEYGGVQDGAAFREQLEETLERCTQTVEDRIPQSGYATECDRRPCDSAMALLLYPFDCNLKIERQNTILRTVYRNMGEAGFRRWEMDEREGPDRYVGQDYFQNPDKGDRGEFAARSSDMRPAEWSLFDPLLAAYFYRRFVESGAREVESFVYADRHMKRAISFITPRPETLHVLGKGRDYQIPSGILPEAFAWDSKREEWRANHNSPLLMAQAALGLAFERGQEATLLVDFHLREARALNRMFHAATG